MSPTKTVADLDALSGTSDNPSRSAVFGHNTTSGDGVTGQSHGGHGVHGQNGDGSGLRPQFGTGVFGASDNGFGVYGSSRTNVGVFGESQSTNGLLGVTHSNSVAAVSGVNKNGGIGLFGEGRIAGSFVGDVEVTGNGRFDGNVEVTGNGRFDGNVEVTGNLHMSSPTSDIVLGDVAEGFDTQHSEFIEPGTVVVLDQHGLVRPGDAAYDKKVAGVVSGAGNYRPAIVLDKPAFASQLSAHRSDGQGMLQGGCAVFTD